MCIRDREHLATAVVEWWRNDKRLGPRLCVKRACADVWHLLEGGAEPLRQVLLSVPEGGVLLIVGGS
eukprot:9492306-Alexandrium_andersonii.AAC.1